MVAPRHFPALDPRGVNPYQSVYSPQVVPATQVERLRFGVVHGAVEGLAETIERRYTPTPLILTSQAEQLALAETLAGLFRCSISSATRRKVAPPPEQPDPAARIAAIHREMAALHVELASLLENTEPRTAPSGAVPAAAPPTPASAPVSPVTSPLKTGPLQHHVAKHVPLSKAKAEHLRAAFLAALQDGRLRQSGVHVGLFGSLVGQRLKGGLTLAGLAPGSLRTWCLAQATAAGIAASIDSIDPSIVRIEG